MRIISTLFFLFSSYSCFSQQTDISNDVIVNRCWGNKIVDSNLSKKMEGRMPVCGLVTQPIKPLRIRLSCQATKRPRPDEILLLVDGKPGKLVNINQLNPNDIEKIEILKATHAMALYGPDGANGAIIITLKMNYKKITIKDALDKSPIAAATVSFNFQGRNTLRYIADDSGILFSNSWKELAKAEMNVSAVGYKTLYRETPGDDSVIYLQRDVKICGEVILTQTYCPKKTGCCVSLYCRCSGIWIKNDSVQAAKHGPVLKNFSIYPNPVQKGSAVTIRFAGENRISAIRILSMGGKNLLQQAVPGTQTNLFRFEADPRWAAGIYFIQLLYENGSVAASGKVILQ